MNIPQGITISSLNKTGHVTKPSTTTQPAAVIVDDDDDDDLQIVSESITKVIQKPKPPVMVPQRGMPTRGQVINNRMRIRTRGGLPQRGMPISPRGPINSMQKRGGIIMNHRGPLQGRTRFPIRGQTRGIRPMNKVIQQTPTSKQMAADLTRILQIQSPKKNAKFQPRRHSSPYKPPEEPPKPKRIRQSLSSMYNKNKQNEVLIEEAPEDDLVEQITGDLNQPEQITGDLDEPGHITSDSPPGSVTCDQDQPEQITSDLDPPAEQFTDDLDKPEPSPPPDESPHSPTTMGKPQIYLMRFSDLLCALNTHLP